MKYKIKIRVFLYNFIQFNFYASSIVNIHHEWENTLYINSESETDFNFKDIFLNGDLLSIRN